jgi:hypothetical protein
MRGLLKDINIEVLEAAIRYGFGATGVQPDK